MLVHITKNFLLDLLKKNVGELGYLRESIKNILVFLLGLGAWIEDN